jgi:hypothetical protein
MIYYIEVPALIVFLQGFQKGRAQFQKNVKNLKNVTPFMVNKMFSYKFYTFKTI